MQVAEAVGKTREQILREKREELRAQQLERGMGAIVEDEDCDEDKEEDREEDREDQGGHKEGSLPSTVDHKGTSKSKSKSKGGTCTSTDTSTNTLTGGSTSTLIDTDKGLLQQQKEQQQQQQQKEQLELQLDGVGQGEGAVEHKAQEELDDETRRMKAELFKDQGNAFIRQKHDLKSAISAYSSAISFLKTNYIYYNNRAAAYLLAGQYESAIADCDSSLALTSNIKAYARKASALGELGRFDTALEFIEKALAIDGQDKEALHVQQVLRTLREEALAAGISLLGPDHGRTENKESTPDAKVLPKNNKNGNDPHQGHKDELKESRALGVDKVKLQPIGAPRLKKRQRNGLQFPSGAPYSFVVKEMGLPGSLLEKSGKFVRVSSSEITAIAGSAWKLPLLELPDSLFAEPDAMSSSSSPRLTIEDLEKVLRESFILKAGQGGVFRARNVRSGTIGGLCIWRYLSDDSGKAFDCVACWNPCEYTHDYDWAEGDKVELLDYLPSHFIKINRSLEQVQVDVGPKQLSLLSSFRVVGNSGWSCGGALAAFGCCGLVGDRWGMLTLEASE